MKHPNYQRLREMAAPKKPRFDPVPFVALGLGLVACGILGAFLTHAAAQAVDVIPPPPDVPFADRYGDSTTVGPALPAIDPNLGALLIHSSPEAPAQPIAWTPPCRGCGESRYADLPSYTEKAGWRWERRPRFVY